MVWHSTVMVPRFGGNLLIRSVEREDVWMTKTRREFAPSSSGKFPGRLHGEWNKLPVARDAEQTSNRHELAQVNYGIRVVRDAVETGAPVGPLKDCLAEVDARERTLEGSWRGRRACPAADAEPA